MKTSEAWALVGGLSKPSKMPGWSIGIPAKECKTGGKLQQAGLLCVTTNTRCLAETVWPRPWSWRLANGPRPLFSIIAHDL